MLCRDFQRKPADTKKDTVLHFCIDTSKPMLQQINKKVILKDIKTSSIPLLSGPVFFVFFFFYLLLFKVAQLPSLLHGF